MLLRDEIMRRYNFDPIASSTLPGNYSVAAKFSSGNLRTKDGNSCVIEIGYLFGILW